MKLKLKATRWLPTYWDMIEWSVDGNGLTTTGRRHLIGVPVIPLGRRKVDTQLLTRIT